MGATLKHRSLIIASALAAASCAQGVSPDAPPVAAASDDAFAAWAAEAFQPISPGDFDNDIADMRALDDLIGDARIVAVSEAVHGSAEAMVFRNRLFRHLVEEKGFTAIAIESGIVEGRVVDDYIHGGDGDFDTVLRRGIGGGFHHYQANPDLVAWMRDYNADPAHAEKLRFFGFDIPGTPYNRFAERGVDTALLEALAYLDRVDPPAAAELRGRLAPVLPSLFNDIAGAMCVAQGGPWCFEVPEADRAKLAEQPQYGYLTAAERDLMTAAIADLVSIIERNELAYVPASSAENYAFGLRAAIGARQTDDFLRHRLPPAWSPADGPPQGAGAQEGRYRAMTDNFEWILDQIGEDGKILVFASRFHISGAPVAVGDNPPDLPFGVDLRRRHADELVAFVNLIGEGVIGCDMELVFEMPPPPETSVDGLASRVGEPLFVLDFHAAPPDVVAWLSQPHDLSHGGTYTLPVGEAFDAAFYSGPFGPACPINPNAPRLPN